MGGPQECTDFKAGKRQGGEGGIQVRGLLRLEPQGVGRGDDFLPAASDDFHSRSALFSFP